MAKRMSKADTVRNLIKIGMGRNNIKNQKELGSYLPFGDAGLSKRIQGQVHWSVSDLRNVDAILNFTPDELKTFVRSAY